MNRKKRRATLFNNMAIVFFFLSSLVIWFLPMADMEKHPVTAIFAGCLFWIGLLGGAVSYGLSCREVQKEEEYKQLKKNEKIAALHPGATREGLAADVMFFPGILITIAGSFFTVLPAPVMLVGMWITILSIYGHFVLNGRVYQFLHPKNHKEMQRRTKSKRKKAEKNQLKEGV